MGIYSFWKSRRCDIYDLFSMWSTRCENVLVKLEHSETIGLMGIWALVFCVFFRFLVPMSHSSVNFQFIQPKNSNEHLVGVSYEHNPLLYPGNW